MDISRNIKDIHDFHNPEHVRWCHECREINSQRQGQKPEDLLSKMELEELQRLLMIQIDNTNSSIYNDGKPFPFNPWLQKAFVKLGFRWLDGEGWVTADYYEMKKVEEEEKEGKQKDDL